MAGSTGDIEQEIHNKIVELTKALDKACEQHVWIRKIIIEKQFKGDEGYWQYGIERMEITRDGLVSLSVEDGGNRPACVLCGAKILLDKDGVCYRCVRAGKKVKG